MPEQPAHVYLRPIGSPLTVGLSGLAVASLVESGLDLHWISKHQTVQVGVILLFVPLVPQLLACVFSYLARDGAAGAAVGLLSVTWGAIGLLHVISRPGSRGGALGLLLVSSAGLLALSAAAVLSGKPLPGTVFLLAATRFACSGIYQLGAGSFWRDLSGLIGLAIVVLSAYAVLAFELEGERLRPVLPTWRRGSARLPGGGLDDATRDIAREAGVRPTT